MVPARISELEVPKGRRVIAISDIHGNLPYFKGLLEKISFSENDELILVGDFLEKGECSLETLRFVMELTRRGSTHPVLGNCDDWFEIFAFDAQGDGELLKYINSRRCGLVWDMLRELGIEVRTVEDMTAAKDSLRSAFPEEWDFLTHLPHAIKAGKYVFAHGGVHSEKPLREHGSTELMHFDNFVPQAGYFQDWVVVGHWPVMLYRESTVNANPFVEREKHIISIDGGNVLKDDGQLNALIIPDIYSEEFYFDSYDSFPTAIIPKAQKGGERSYYIRWGDNKVRVLSRGEEFSRCRHIRTGYEMDILSRYLYSDGEETSCNDCTDYVLPLEAGDTVSVVERTSRGCLVKHKGVSGWYWGEL